VALPSGQTLDLGPHPRTFLALFDGQGNACSAYEFPDTPEASYAWVGTSVRVDRGAAVVMGHLGGTIARVPFAEFTH
jgi:hypothetical protein